MTHTHTHPPPRLPGAVLAPQFREEKESLPPPQASTVQLLQVCVAALECRTLPEPPEHLQHHVGTAVADVPLALGTAEPLTQQQAL